MRGQPPTEVTIDGFTIESASTLDRGAPLSSDELAAEVKGYLEEGGLAEKEPTLEVDPELTPADTPAAADRDDAGRFAKPAPAADPAPAAPAEPAKPKKGDRIGELQADIHHHTREKHRIVSEAEAEQNRLNQLRAERLAEERLAEQRRTGKPAAEDSAAAAAAAAPAAADDPMPDWEADDEAGLSFTQHQKKLTAWISRDVARRTEAAVAQAMGKVDARTAEEREAAETERVTQAIDTRHRTNLDRLHAEKPDFAQLIADEKFAQMPRTAFVTTLIKLHDKGPDVLYALAKNPDIGYSFADLPLSEPMKEAFRECDDPVALVTALANNREEAQRIAHLGRGAALRAMLVLETTQGTGAKTGPPTPGGKTATPPLPARVGGARSVAGPKPIDQLSTDSDEDVSEYIARMNKEEGIPAP
jgi:hypothetical protein